MRKNSIKNTRINGEYVSNKDEIVQINKGERYGKENTCIFN